MEAFRVGLALCGRHRLPRARGRRHGARVVRRRPVRPAPPEPGEAAAVRVRHRARHGSAAALVRALLHDRHAVRHLRRRGRLVLPVGGAAPDPARPGPARHGALRPRARRRLRLRVEEGRTAMAVSDGTPFILTTVEQMARWGQKNSIWPLTMGLACCAIEMMSLVTARFDSARFGAEVFRASPRQADLMIVSGRVCHKMVPVIKQLYEQMPEPKWVMSMGSCACSGGVFNNYA